MAQCEELVDMELFDLLWTWKHGGESNFQSRRDKIFRKRLVSRLEAAESPAMRVLVFRYFRVWFSLDEETACQLYRIDPKAASPFLRRRIPTSYWSGEKRVLWSTLLALAEAEGDTRLASEVYRRTIPFKSWRADLERFCAEISDPDRLNETLTSHHPLGYLKNIGGAFVTILQERGRDVMPYVKSHLEEVRTGLIFRGAYNELVAIARENRWWDLWTATVRIVGGPKEFNAAVQEVLALPQGDARVRLAMLAGISREFNWGGFGLAQVSPLEDKTAVELYQKYPDLVRRAFRPNIEYLQTCKKPQFLETLIATEDDDLIDYVACRTITRSHFWDRAGKERVERLADYYERLKGDPQKFARRACAVLTQIPAYTIFDYRSLIKLNRLARLLFERSPQEFLGTQVGLQDLVEAQKIHVMGLAYRLLAMDDERARQAAATNVEILIGTLFRPIRRKTRLPAFTALVNAADTETKATRILAKAREALDLPDKFYPKEELVGLMGLLLHRWPSLRGEHEHPHTFRAA